MLFRSNFDLDVAAAYNYEMVKAKRKTIASYVHTHVAAMPNFGGNLAISARELGD